VYGGSKCRSPPLTALPNALAGTSRQGKKGSKERKERDGRVGRTHPNYKFLDMCLGLLSVAVPRHDGWEDHCSMLTDLVTTWGTDFADENPVSPTPVNPQ